MTGAAAAEVPSPPNGAKSVPNEPWDVPPPGEHTPLRRRGVNPKGTPPHDLETEALLLRCALYDPDAAPVVAALPDDAWYMPAHGHIANAIRDLDNAGEYIDPVTVRARLIQTGAILKVGGEQGYLDIAAAASGSAKAAEKYAAILRRLARSRRLVSACDMARHAAMAGDPEGALSHLSPVVEEVDASDDAGTMDRLVPAYVELLKRRESGDEVVISTRMRDLDAIIGGLHPGNLVTVGARTGQGKTAFACQLTLNLSLDGHRVLYVSREMPWMQLFDRWVGNWGKIDTRRLRAGDMRDDGWARATTALKRLESRGLRIARPATMTVPAVRAEARQHKADCVIVDYLQLLNAVGTRNTNRENDVGEVSRTLKAMSLQLDIPVVALAQLNRGVESRPNKKPELYDLRDSGQIEQDSDVVICAYRESAYDDTADPNQIELLVRKNRHGDQESCLMTFIGPYQQVLDRAPGHRGG